MKSVKRTALLLAIVMILTSSVITYAAIKYTTWMSNAGRILGYEFTVFRSDTGQPVNVIPWGDLDQGTNRTTDEIFNGTLVVKNMGDKDLYFGWHVNSSTPLPSGVTLTCILGTSVDLPEDSYYFINAGNSYAIRWTLIVSNSASRGSFAFDIVLLAADSSSG